MDIKESESTHDGLGAKSNHQLGALYFGKECIAQLCRNGDSEWSAITKVVDGVLRTAHTFGSVSVITEQNASIVVTVITH